MKLCIIAGSGGLPINVAKEKKDAFVLCIKDHSHTSLFQNRSSIVSLLDPDNWIKILKKNNISHIVMAGKINRPKVINKKLSKSGTDLINKISSLGDDSASKQIYQPMRCYKGIGANGFINIVALIICPPLGVFMSYGLRGFLKILICAGLSLLYYL